MIYFHHEEHTSGRHLLRVLREDSFGRNVIAPPDGIDKSAFFEAINSRGLEQLMYLFEELQVKAASVLPSSHMELGDLVAIDGSLVDACLSLLAEMGSEIVEVTKLSGDGGIDVRGTLVVGDVVRIKMAVQVKKWKLKH